LRLTRVALMPGCLQAMNVSQMPEVRYTANDRQETLSLPLSRHRIITFLNGLRSGEGAGPGVPDVEDFCRYEGESMWQFVASDNAMYYFYVMVMAEMVLRVIDETGAQVVEIEPSDEPFGLLWEESAVAACRLHGVEARHLGHTRRRGLRDPLHPFGLFRLTRKVQRRWHLGRIKLREMRQPQEQADAGPRLMFVTFARHWKRVGDGSGGHIDDQFTPILAALQNRGWRNFVGVDCPYTQDLGNVARVFGQRLDEAGPDVKWRSFFGATFATLEAQRARGFFRRQHAAFREAVRANPEAFRYLDMDLSRALEMVFVNIFHTMLPESVRMRVAARALLEQERPAVVLMTYETGPYQRALIVEARRLGIPTVAIMHGFISDMNNHYMHTGVTAERLDPPAGFSVPDRTCVWGDFFRRVMTEQGNYRPEQVAVTGNWQYDQGFAGLEPETAGTADERTVLVCTSKQWSARFVQTCLDAIAVTGGLRCLVKSHPLEDPAEVQAVVDAESRVKVEVCEGSMLEALRRADIVVSLPSTVAYEAVLLDKPLVMVNTAHNPSFAPLVESGACVTLTETGSLGEVLGRLCGDEELKGELAEARAAFVSDCFYVRDGKAAERVVEVVEGLVGRVPGQE
jgi:hypothetical protein